MRTFCSHPEKAAFKASQASLCLLVVMAPLFFKWGCADSLGKRSLCAQDTGEERQAGVQPGGKILPKAFCFLQSLQSAAPVKVELEFCPGTSSVCRGKSYLPSRGTGDKRSCTPAAQIGAPLMKAVCVGELRRCRQGALPGVPLFKKRVGGGEKPDTCCSPTG